MTPSSIISGIPPTSDATTGRDSAIDSRIDRPWASRHDGSTATSNPAVTAGTSSRRPVKITRWATRWAAAHCSRKSRREPSPTIRRYASGQVRRTCGHASISVWWPFSGSSRATTPTIRLPGSSPNSSRIGDGPWWSYRWRSTPL